MYKAYTFRMYPSDLDKIKLNQNIGSSLFIYNYHLDMKKKLYETSNQSLSLKDMKKGLVNLKKEFEWLRDVDSCVLRTSLEDLDDAYIRFFSKQGAYPKFKNKHSRCSYRTNCIRSSYKEKNYSNIKVDLNRKLIKLPKIGYIPIRGYRNLRELPGRVINATVSRDNGRYYVSVCVEFNIDIPEFRLRNAVGIDLGVKNLVVTSDGIKYSAMKAIRKYEKKIRGLNRWLSRCQKKSKNRVKVIKKLQVVYRKLRNSRKYYTHLITSTLVRENDMLVTENLKVQDMMEKSNHIMSKYLSDSCFGEIIRQLEYKCCFKGKKLVKISTYYASSQICNVCKQRNKEVKNLNIRKWECKNCGCLHDRDINASINILEEGIFKYYKEQYAK